jgi:RecA/RadA recombinase
MMPVYPLGNILKALQLIQKLQPDNNTIWLYFNQLRVNKKMILNQYDTQTLEKFGWFINEEENCFCYDF